VVFNKTIVFWKTWDALEHTSMPRRLVHSLISAGRHQRHRHRICYPTVLEPDRPVCCRYVTFAALAGADPFDERAAAAGLPPVDGHNLWPLLSGENATSPRTEVRPELYYIDIIGISVWSSFIVELHWQLFETLSESVGFISQPLQSGQPNCRCALAGLDRDR
jgi:hypothetical protein